jgi:integrase
MPRTINRLSARTITATTKPGLIADGGGLYLQTSPAGTKSWIYRFARNGKTRDMGLGPVYTVTLSSAREAAAACRSFVRDGLDPIERRRTLKLAELAADAKTLTFEQCANAYIEAQQSGWRNAKHADQWQNTLKQYAYPVFGSLPVSAIDTGLVLEVLEPIWKTKTETASRVRGRIENILDWASVHNHRQGENPARWRGHLDKTLPERAKVQKVVHHPALDYEDIGSFMAALRERTELSARALELLILTATRTIEVLGAEWNEFDFEAGVWVIPAGRMKGGIEHRVPLSDAALAILKDLPRLEGNDHVFPGMKRARPLSNMACLKLLDRMGHGDITGHGFRSTFRDWAGEQTAFPREVAEHALAHKLKDKAEAAYQRRDFFDKRAMLMRAWSDYCSIGASERGGAAGKVVPIRSKSN